MATTKKKARKRASPSQLVVRLLTNMPHGELARLPEALVAIDVDVARFLATRLASAIPPPSTGATGSGSNPVPPPSTPPTGSGSRPGSSLSTGSGGPIT